MEIPVVGFPAQVTATDLVRESVIQGKIPGLAFPVEAFPVMAAVEGGDFVRESRTAVNRKVACRQVGGATAEAGH